jgi:hypothetical protein
VGEWCAGCGLDMLDVEDIDHCGKSLLKTPLAHSVTMMSPCSQNIVVFPAQRFEPGI